MSVPEFTLTLDGAGYDCLLPGLQDGRPVLDYMGIVIAYESATGTWQEGWEALLDLFRDDEEWRFLVNSEGMPLWEHGSGCWVTAEVAALGGTAHYSLFPADVDDESWDLLDPADIGPTVTKYLAGDS